MVKKFFKNKGLTFFFIFLTFLNLINFEFINFNSIKRSQYFNSKITIFKKKNLFYIYNSILYNSISYYLLLNLLKFFSQNVYASDLFLEKENLEKIKNEALYYFENKFFNKVLLISLPIINSKIYLEKFSKYEKDFFYYLIGVSYFFLNDYNNSKNYFNKIESEYFKINYEYVEFYKGLILFFEQKYSEAVFWFNKISKFEDGINEIGKYYYYFSVSLIQIGEYDLAFYFLNKGLNSIDEYYKPYLSFTVGRLYFNLSLFDKAEIEFRRFLLKYANSDLIDDTIYYLGKSYYKQKKYKEAKDEFNIIIKNYPKSEYFYYSYYYLGKITGNKIYFEIIALNKPDFENIDYVFYYLGKLEDNKDLSKIYFENCINNTKDKVLAYNSLTFILNLLNNYKEKLDAILNYIEKIDYEDKVFNFALNLIYNNFDFNYFKVFYENYYLKNEEKYKTNYEVLYNIGRIFSLMNNHEKSLEFFLKAYRFNKDDYKLNYYIGYSFFEIKNFDEAFVYLNRSIENNKKKDIFYDLSIKLIGFYYINKNDLNKAFDIFNNFLEKNRASPLYYEIMYYFSIISFNLKKYNTAYDNIKKCLDVIQEKDLLYNNILYNSIKIISKKNLDESLNLYKNKVINLDKDFFLGFYLIDSYINAKEYNKALDLAETIYNMGDDKVKIDSSIKKYLIFYNLKNYEKAIEVIKKVEKIEMDYKKDLITYYLIESSLMLKNDDFKKYFEKLLNYKDRKLIYDASYLIFSYFYKEKDLDNAILYIDYCLKYNDDSEIKNNLLFNKANILYEKDYLNESAQILEDLLDKRYNENVIGNFLFAIYIKQKNIEKIKEKAIFNIYNNDSEEIKYLALVYLFYLKDFNFFEESSFKEILNYFINNRISNRTYFLASYIYGYYFNYDFQKFIKDYRTNIQSKDLYLSFWTRFFFALYYLKEKDYNNSYKVLEAITEYNFVIEKEIVFYYLYFLEKNGFVKNNKYLDINKFLKDSFILGIIKKN